MKRNRIVMTALAATLLFCEAAVSAARDYKSVVGQNFWNEGSNITGIRQDSVSAAYAEISGDYVEGGLRSAHDALSAWTAGARTAAIRHMDRFSLAGSFGFSQMWGKDMSGSMFIRPDFFPVSVYEFTPGPKTLQTYDFSGGVSVDMAPQWRIGANMDYTAANFSKRKDLRHTTYLLDMTVSPGIQFHRNDIALGLNYIFRKTTETVTAEQIGSTVSGYYAFLDKGLYYGAEELWTGSGIHLKDPGVNGLPLSETMNGAALQFSKGDFYADIEALVRSGKAGEKQGVSFRFDGYQLDARLRYRVSTPSWTHILRLDAGFFSQTNVEASLQRVTTGGVTTTVEVASNPVFSRSTANLSLSYDALCRSWELGAFAGLDDREGAVYEIYPYLATEKFIIPYAGLSAARHFGRIYASMSLKWSDGHISDSFTTVNDGAGISKLPVRLDRYFLSYREYFSSEKITVIPSVRYDLGHDLFLQASLSWEKGFGIEYLPGSSRTAASMKLIYQF